MKGCISIQVTLQALTGPGPQQRKPIGIDLHVPFIIGSKLMTSYLVLLILHCPESFESIGLKHSSGVLLMFAHLRHLGTMMA